MGAAAGHICHLQENPSLTFKEIKDIFEKITNGKMLVTEKLDGICVHLSYSIVDGKARAARNYKNINEGGITLENVNLLTEVTQAIGSLTEAIKVFEQTIKKIPVHEQVEIFGPNANYYYNCEVQDPNNINVLLYDRPLVTIHRSGHLKFNKFNKQITQEIVGEQFLKLEKLLLNSPLNEEVNDGFIVKTNEIKKLEELKDKSCYYNSLISIQNEIKKYNLSDKSSIAEYVLSRLDELIDSKIELPKKCKIKLLERLMHAEGITAKQVYESLNLNNCPHLIEEVRQIISSEKKLLKEAISPVEQIITEFGSNVLKEFKSSYIKDPNKEIQRLRNKLTEISNIVGNSANQQAQDFFNSQFSRIKNVDNINSACEGVVFKYDGNLYKLTGLFSPLNQILGMMNYQRGNVPPLKTFITTMNENKTAIISWGRFNPPTIGHEIVFKIANDLAKKDKADFFIIPSETTDKQKNPLTLQEKISYISKI